VYDIQVKKNHNFFANGLLVHNCVIFQEQVMELAEKVAGFPKDKCDEVRRAIMKRSISGGEAAKKVAQETRDGFVKGCIANGYTDQVANNLYDKILYFAGYAFNRSHAVAYAIDSFWCAWLMTYHEEQWLTAYVESMLGNPDKKSKAFGEIKKLGYTIVPIDINHAGMGWTVLPGKKFMPSLLSCKGVGETAAEEIIASRPYESLEQMLYNEDGSWRPSKFNKKALETLIKVRAFDSLDCVGPDKLFHSYQHMHDVLIEASDDIKKSPKKDPNLGRKTMYELARALGRVEEWSRLELAKLAVEAFGSLDVSALLDPAVLAKLEEKNVRPIDEWDVKGYYWFCIQETIPKKTKAGKNYLIFKAVGPVGKEYKVNAWGWDGVRKFEPLTVVIAEVDRNDFGFSTTLWRCKELT
jgi:DNA polymerase III alpha subunit